MDNMNTVTAEPIPAVLIEWEEVRYNCVAPYLAYIRPNGLVSNRKPDLSELDGDPV